MKRSDVITDKPKEIFDAYSKIDLNIYICLSMDVHTSHQYYNILV